MQILCLRQGTKVPVKFAGYGKGMVINMCETLDFIEKRGMERGIEQEIEHGIKELVGTVKEFTNSKEKAIESLVKRYELTQETAKEKVEQYWVE